MISFINLTRRNARYAEAFAAIARAAIGKPLILGEQVRRFEQAWAAYCQKKYCVGVGNGYDALMLMLRASGIQPGCRVIVQTNAHVAAWLAVDAVGARIVPVEPDPETHQVDADRILAADELAGGVDAVLVTFMYGKVPDMATLSKVAHARGAHLLVDASHAHGIGGALLGDAAAFSFYPTKNLGALGDAGAVVTDSPRIAPRIAALRNYGSITKNVHSLRYGCNSRLDEVQAALLNVKLPQLDRDNDRRGRIARTYLRALGQESPRAPDVHHLFPVRSRDRAAAQERLAARGIETGRYYPTPPHRQEAFAHLGYGAGAFPVAEQLAQDTFCVPSGPELTDEEAVAVANELQALAHEKALA